GVVAADVGDREAVAGVLASVEAGHPLTAVVHAAGVLADGVFGGLSGAGVERVFGPKVDGAWHLHELTRGLDLAAFVVFSSAAGVFGNAGQSAYGAANAFLDALAVVRRGEGLAGVSLAWGLWEEVSGLTGGLDGRARGRLARSGLRGLSTGEALALFDAGLRSGEAVLVPTGLDWGALRAQAAAGDLNPLLRTLVRPPRRTTNPDTPAIDDSAGFVRRLAALSPKKQHKELLDLVRGAAAAVLGHASKDDLGPSQAFKDSGFDSLGALQLRNRLARATGTRLPATLTFDHPTPLALAVHLRSELLAEPEPGPETGPETGSQPETESGPRPGPEPASATTPEPESPRSPAEVPKAKGPTIADLDVDGLVARALRGRS
ncbi:KR domain-containing protein, partial [Streptomyces ziwulingensis]|uniref:KR domain-containing protein n=1 Tax=Streptomyces ziwulingensis TaxID=1045501 RepID=UPI0031E882A6